jgi:hypothetical protein
MSSYTNYCIKPNYFTGVSGWANSSTNDQWLIKNRGNNVKYNTSTVLYDSTLHTNRDEPHGAFVSFVPKNSNFSVDNGRGDSKYFQCKEI